MIALSFEGGVTSPLDLSVPDHAKVLDGVEFPFSNDASLYARFDELTQGKSVQPYCKTDAAIIVGNGALLSMLPVLPEHIYLTDYSPEHLRWMNVLIEQVRDTPSHIEFVDWANDLLKREAYKRRQDALAWESSSLGLYHHTASQRRYANSRAQLLDTEINLVEIDYTDLPSVQAFGSLLRESGSEIRVANFTNMMAHIVLGALGEEPETPENFINFRAGLSSLPVTHNAQIFASDSKLRLPLPTATTMEDFVATAKRDVQEEFENILLKTEKKYKPTGTAIQPKSV